jgi:hypothetical protein
MNSDQNDLMSNNTALGISKDTKIQEIALSLLKPNPRNPRIAGANEAELKQSLSRFNQQIPIIVDHDYNIVAGHQRYLAAQSLGWKKMACIVTDLPAQELTRFMIADNQTAAKGQWDYKGLQGLVLDNYIDLEELGFNAQDISDIARKITDLQAKPLNESEDQSNAFSMKDFDAANAMSPRGDHRFVLNFDEDQNFEFQDLASEIATALKVAKKDVEFIVIAAMRDFMARRR